MTHVLTFWGHLRRRRGGVSSAIRCSWGRATIVSTVIIHQRATSDKAPLVLSAPGRRLQVVKKATECHTLMNSSAQVLAPPPCNFDDGENCASPG